MEDNSGTLTMELTDYMTNLVKETFDLELEMLQGTVEILPDGRTKYVVEVGHEKGKLIMKFILMTISKSYKLNYN